MGQTQLVRGRAPTTHTDASGYTTIIYHSTPVVSFNSKEIILNTGGWRTLTTRTRMNQASNQYNLGYHIPQRNFSWFITTSAGTFPFSTSHIRISRRTLKASPHA